MKLKRICQILLLLMTIHPVVTAQESLDTTPSTQKVSQDVAKETFTTLAGPLPRLLRADRSPYLVTADIEVPPMRTVTIEPGTVLLFRNFSGLHVRGRLIAEGTKNDPIVFTSENDHVYDPLNNNVANPYDWNGIYIHPDGFGSRLNFCAITYSVYSLISETKFIRIDPIKLKHNGKQFITIEGLTELKANANGEYKWILSSQDAAVNGVPVDILKDPLALRRNVVRYTSIVAVLGGCAAGTYQIFEVERARQIYKDRSSDRWNNVSQYAEADYKKARSDYINETLLMGAGYLIGLTGVICFSWTFTF